MLIFALKAGFKYDVFHSHAGYSLLPFNIDVGILKLFKRRIFAEFHGSELKSIRVKYKYEYFNADWENIRMKQKQQKRVARLLKSTTGVIIHDYELLSIFQMVVCCLFILSLFVWIFLNFTQSIQTLQFARLKLYTHPVKEVQKELNKF